MDNRPCKLNDESISSVEHVPVDDYTLPLSSAEVLQIGDTITLLSWGAPLYSCVEAINMLRTPPTSIAAQVPQGIRSANVELIDLRTILPWDRESKSRLVEIGTGERILFVY